MTPTTKKRAALTTAALGAVALAALTGCSGSGSATDATGGKAGKPSPTRQASPAEHLAQLMVTPAEVGGRTVAKPSGDFAFARSTSEVTVDKPACAPLAYAMNQLPLGAPQADLTRVVQSDKTDAPFTYITLTAYGPGGAESALSGLEKAVGACGAGFTAKSKNGSSTYGSVAAERPVAPGGSSGSGASDGSGGSGGSGGGKAPDKALDKAVAFKATMTVQGVTHTLHTEAVRAGDVVAVYFSVNGMAMMQNRPSDAKPLPAVVNAQNAKLR